MDNADFDAEFAESPTDSERYLTPVGNQDALEHGCRHPRLVQRRDASALWADCLNRRLASSASLLSSESVRRNAWHLPR